MKGLVVCNSLESPKGILSFLSIEHTHSSSPTEREKEVSFGGNEGKGTGWWS